MPARKTKKAEQEVGFEQVLAVDDSVLKETRALIAQIRDVGEQMSDSKDEATFTDLQKHLFVLLGQLRFFSWKSQRLVKDIKDETALGRQEADNALLNVQNVRYRQKHLRGEIENKMSYGYKHEIDLEPIEEFLKSHPESQDLQGHELLMARLRDEEQRRLDLFVKRTELQERKNNLSKVVKSLKDDLDDTGAMDQKLKVFMNSMEPLRQYFYKH